MVEAKLSADQVREFEIIRGIDPSQLPNLLGKHRMTSFSEVSLRDKNKNALIFECVKEGKHETFKTLLRMRDDDINKEVNGHTLLTSSILNQAYDRFSLIAMEEGVLFHYTTSAGFNPVKQALMYGHESYFQVLMEMDILPYEVYQCTPMSDYSPCSMNTARSIMFVCLRVNLIFAHENCELLAKIPKALIRDIASFL